MRTRKNGLGIVTETLARIYLSQGHRQEALRLYRRLLEREPDNARYRQMVESLGQRKDRLTMRREILYRYLDRIHRRRRHV